MKYERIAIAVLDGVGIGKKDKGDMVEAAYMPTYKSMLKDDDMGNSEVGHNALGSGQVISQGAKLVDEAIATKKIYETDTWKSLVENCKNNNSKMHFIGLLSDGNVHSNISHLIDLLKNAKAAGIKKCFVHALWFGTPAMVIQPLTRISGWRFIIIPDNNPPPEYPTKITGCSLAVIFIAFAIASTMRAENRPSDQSVVSHAGDIINWHGRAIYTTFGASSRIARFRIMRPRGVGSDVGSPYALNAWPSPSI